MIPGAHYLGEGICHFRVWAPFAEEVQVQIQGEEQRLIPLQKEDYGYWSVQAGNIYPGTEYMYLLEAETLRPDPASYFQPYDVHGPSRVIDHKEFGWQDGNWKGQRVEDLVFYELHVGSFTPEGTFQAIIPRLSELRSLGITALNIMPVAQFPGKRNWGYDGVQPYAVQNSYGGPNALKSLVNACHEHGLAVFLDVVYNHLGPEGNYLRDFGPYFTDRYRTPWGEALNFDGPYSDQVRNYFIQNALYWLDYFHLDGLRLDAVHAIYDHSAVPFLQELAETVDSFAAERNQPYWLIAESDLNDSRLIRPRDEGGYGLAGQWSDDFHHALHTLLTGEKKGYYQDFGEIEDLAAAYENAYVYCRRYSHFRKRTHGNSTQGLPDHRFVVCAQNHDQVGNRMLGERLSQLTSFEGLKLSAASVIHAPFLPLLFMGEEFAASSPFLYFVDHSDPDLIEAVRKGRKEEFASFAWQGEPPDPQHASTFEQSRIDWEKRTKGKHQKLLELYTELLRLRFELSGLRFADSLKTTILKESKSLMLLREQKDQRILNLLCFGHKGNAKIEMPKGQWEKLLDTADKKWLGPGSNIQQSVSGGAQIEPAPLSYVLFRKSVK
jgi:maltooligosyltrehalose trehalohydrolase